jgi:2-hydroxychromene-2-carboxylate isomerase
LDENTQKAFASGAFGLPWFDCISAEGDKEGHWGIDHLGRVADFLRLDTTVDQSFKVLL